MVLIPAPPPAPSDEQDLDAILGNIDRLVEHQVRKATNHRNGNTPDPLPPTQCFSPARVKKTQHAFQVLSESKLFLDESRSDMRAISKDEEPSAASAPKPAPAPRKSIWPWKNAAIG